MSQAQTLDLARVPNTEICSEVMMGACVHGMVRGRHSCTVAGLTTYFALDLFLQLLLYSQYR